MTHRIVALLVSALASLAIAGAALAHAELVSSDPPAGGTLTTTPYTLTATFDDELTADGSSILIENASGAQVAAGTVSETDEHSMTAELPALPNGAYTVRWTAVSADDAAVERGTYTFNVGAAAASATPTTTPPPFDDGVIYKDDTTLIAMGLALLAIGGVVAYVFLRRRR